MRIRKQTKFALSLILGTLITVFAVALLLVTIVEININSPSQIVSDTPLVEPSQSHTKPVEIIPQQPSTDNKEQTHQEEPAVVPPAPPSAVINNDSIEFEMNPQMPVNIKPALVIIVLIVLAAAIIAVVALLIRNLARNRLHEYGGADYEGDVAHGESQNICEAEEQDVCVSEDADIHYKESRGYCFVAPQIDPCPDADVGSFSPDFGAGAELTPESNAYISSSRSDNLEYHDTGESDMDHVDIPRLFVK